MMMRYQACRLLSIFFSVLMLASTGTVPALFAESRRPDHLQLVDAINAAEARAVQSRLDLAQWRLARLESLSRAGHATWMELQRARVDVERFEARKVAVERFASFLDQVRRHGAKGTDEQMKDASPPMKLVLPGSTRLIAWVHAGHLPPEVLANHLAAERSRSMKMLDDARVRLKATKAASAAADRRSGLLAEIYNSDESLSELQRANLESAVARADLELATAIYGRCRHKHDVASHREAAPMQSAVTSDPSEHLVNYRDDDALRDATRQVAAAEAAAGGRVRVAQLTFERREMRRSAIRNLHASGHASQCELIAAESESKSAREWLGICRAQHATLVTAKQQINDATARVSFASNSVAVEVRIEHLPEGLLASPEFVEHLIDLRRQLVRTASDRHAAKAEYEMYQARREKLIKIGSDNEAARNERQLARLELELAEARLDELRQQQIILRLEERRFVEQARLQTGGPPVSFYEPADADIFFATAGREVGDSHTAGLPRGPVGQFAAISQRCLSFSCEAANVAYPPGVANSAATRCTARSSPATQRSPLAIDIQCLERPVTASGIWFAVCPPRSSGNSSASEAPSHTGASQRHVPIGIFSPQPTTYFAGYAFGNRKSIAQPPWRRLVTPYGGPWYLPGSPTNFR